MAEVQTLDFGAVFFFLCMPVSCDCFSKHWLWCRDCEYDIHTSFAWPKDTKWQTFVVTQDKTGPGWEFVVTCKRKINDMDSCGNSIQSRSYEAVSVCTFMCLACSFTRADINSTTATKMELQSFWVSSCSEPCPCGDLGLFTEVGQADIFFC